MVLVNALVTPGIGLVFWTSVVFVVLLFLLSKFAWKPILGAVKEREENIDKALKLAEKAKQDLRDLQNTNEKLAADARAERDAMLKEARDLREKLISESKEKANAEAQRIIASAHDTIVSEKNAAVAEIKTLAANLSIEIAENILRSELSSDAKQKALTGQLLEDAKLN